MKALVLEGMNVYASSETATLTFDHDNYSVWIKGEVEDTCYNFRVNLTETDRKMLIEWLEDIE